MVSTGTREICLLGQNVNSYKANGVDFVELLQRLDKINGLQRLRFISPHPKDFHEKFGRRNCFITFSLRTTSPSPSIRFRSNSARMRRWYKMETYYQKVAMLRERLPDATLSTDIIVGFPGETMKSSK
ncbi:MAG: hypothetical protein CM1200mP28_12150 [Deltaproteobacteria bacterium]|nr:MAG: hypothetical protein CM1200mP28_12150 [Deltaproteobacteria bacterium]